MQYGRGPDPHRQNNNGYRSANGRAPHGDAPRSVPRSGMNDPRAQQGYYGAQQPPRERAQRDPRMDPRMQGGYDPRRGAPRSRTQQSQQSRGYAGAQQDPRGYNAYGGYTDPRQRGYGGQTAYGAQNNRSSQSNYGGQSGFGAQYSYGAQNSYGSQSSFGAQSGYSRGGQPNGRGYSSYGGGYRDPRAEEYVRQRREAQLRAERARRMEYERRRAAAREARRRLEEQIKKERKLRRQRMRKIFCGHAIICLIIFALLAVLTTVGVILHFNSSPDSPPARTTYTYGGTKIRTVAENVAYRGGNAYVCFNDVADYLDLSVTGDTESMKFVFNAEPADGSEGSGSEDSVVFYNDSRTVLISDQKMTLPAETFFFGEEVWVSCEFIELYVDGLSINKNGKTIAVACIKDEENSTDDTIAFLPVTLKLKDSAPHPDIDLEEGEDDRVVLPQAPDELEFATDLSEYEQYMSPESPEEYLILVNNSAPADSTLVPADLTAVVDTRQDGREAQQLRLSAAKALEALFIEMREAGITDVSVMSGYRDYWTQDYLHNYYIEQEMAADPTLSWEAAKAIVLTYSSEAGTSEHQTGLCVDMHNLDSADVSFANDPAFAWLQENAWKFGYILRYPEDGTASTGISFEPWHWRFVGREAAYAITKDHLTLEQYLAGEGE